jgi:hypothetical protein
MEKHEPRGACAWFFVDHNIEKPEQLTKAYFDGLCEAGSFADGPHVDSFGDGHGEPYNPYRQAFGILKDGRGVYAETHRARQ